MKKNGQYVGVDEKYIPEDEKYENNNLNSEIKNDIHNIYHGAKEYVSDKDNQEKMKKVGRKGLKIVKGIGIGYLVFAGIVIVLGIAGFIIAFSQFFKIRNNAADIINQSVNRIDNNRNEMNVYSFNFDIEAYSGTQYGSAVSLLLDNVVTKIKKNSDHQISVIYDTTTTNKASEITALKKQFNDTTKYEVSLDYDSDGYINKITITNY